MSNRQLGWDDQQIRDRLSPRELDDHDREALNQQEAQEGPAPGNDAKDKVIESNRGSHSHEK